MFAPIATCSLFSVLINGRMSFLSFGAKLSKVALVFEFFALTSMLVINALNPVATSSFLGVISPLIPSALTDTPTSPSTETGLPSIKPVIGLSSAPYKVKTMFLFLS